MILCRTVIRTQGYDDKYGITPHPCRYSTCYYAFHQPIDVEKGDPTVSGREVSFSLRCTKAERASTTRNLGLGLSSGFWGSESETEISKRLRVTVWSAFAANILRRPNKQTHPCTSAANPPAVLCPLFSFICRGLPDPLVALFGFGNFQWNRMSRIRRGGYPTEFLHGL